MKSATEFALGKRCLSIWFIVLFSAVAAAAVSAAQNRSLDTLFSFTVGGTFLASSQNASFQDSCQNISVNGNTLSARCRTERGNYVSTSIEIRGITNVNGNLEYLRDGRGRSTFQDSCTDIRVGGATLTAQCRREDNSYSNTSIFLRGIINDNGRLQYGRGGGDDSVNPPSDNFASFQDSCRNIRVSVTTLSAQCRSENGRWRDSTVEIRGITNVNGNLEYLRDGRGRSTYQETCRNISIAGSTLMARCERENGSLKRASISLIGIVNDNGRLRYKLD
jgi:hypothetical protein